MLSQYSPILSFGLYKLWKEQKHELQIFRVENVKSPIIKNKKLCLILK